MVEQCFNLSVETNMHTIVIGSGIAGLAAAIRLRLAGDKVTVYEARSTPGGKLYSFEERGYRFDGGPSLFTMPHLVDELFAAAGKDPRAYFNYNQSDEACRYFWKDGIALKAPASPHEFAQEAQRVFGVDASAVIDYFDHMRNIYDSSAKIFLEKSLHKSSTWMSRATLTSLLKIRQFDLLKSMHDANVTRLKEPHLVQLFDRFATYNGSNPYRAPGILNVIPWFEHGFGTFFPRGGMSAVPKALHLLAEELGVTFHFNQRVDEILLQQNRVRGVRIKHTEISADRVISNMDVYFTYRQLLPTHPAPDRILKQERSSSALVFYWGINGSFDELGLHNIFFSEDYQSEFNALFHERAIPKDPSIYVHISSKMEQSDAPPGKENWFVMVNVPSHTGQDWQILAQQTRKTILEKLSARLGRPIEPLIETERVWDPSAIERDTMSYQGALYGSSSNSKFAAFLRHPNYANRLKGLYFCGGSVHPGGGIPLALLSARITSEIIAKP